MGQEFPSAAQAFVLSCILKYWNDPLYFLHHLVSAGPRFRRVPQTQARNLNGEFESRIEMSGGLLLRLQEYGIRHHEFALFDQCLSCDKEGRVGGWIRDRKHPRSPP